MERNILDQLYFGKIVPWENNNGSSPEMQEVRDQIDEDIGTLRAMLSDEGKAVFERLLRNRSALEDRIVCEGFKDGFRLGSKLTLATFYSGKQV